MTIGTMTENLSNTGRIAAGFAGPLGAFRLDVQFEAPLRGVTALFGPSGSGKTTILRCMAGLQHLSGHLSVDGQTWQDDARGIFVKSHRRAVGYVFQEASLFAHLSVRENLMFGLRRALKNKSTPALDFDGAVSMLGLKGLLGRAPDKLSGGERQRVAVGRALLSQPEMLLMDEPLAALDAASKGEILPYLETLHETLSIPVIYVSHDLSEVARLADRIIVLSEGRVSAEGPADRILERLDLPGYAQRFEAGVILSARVVRHEPEYQLTHVDHGGQSLVMPKIAADVGQTVRLRVLARDVALATAMPAGLSVRNILEGTIKDIHKSPDSPYAEILIDLGNANIRSRITRAAVDELELTVGKRVYALIKSVTFER